MTSRYDPDRAQLAELLAGTPRYRLDQVWDGLYRDARPLEDITNLPKALRAELADALPPALELVTESVSDGGDTRKFLWRLPDGATIESVLMHSPDRSTICISTQAGCAMACSFCATGQAGFERHLTVGEIVEQVMEGVRRSLPKRLSHVVFMGMGEPLANYDGTWAAVERFQGDLGLSARHLTISTVGLPPGIRRLAREQLPVTLAVSLHAASDELRDELVPINRRYPLAALIEACEDYRSFKNRRLTFEWALIDGVNDTDDQARRLAAIARPLGAHINLIPLNPTPGYPVIGSPPERVRAFVQQLGELGANATVRRTRGREIDAACGQLRLVEAGKGARSTTGAEAQSIAAPTRRSSPR